MSIFNKWSWSADSVTEQRERLIVLETQFHDSQNALLDHMRYEKSQFEKVERSLQLIVQHIDTAKKQNRQDITVLKEEILDMLKDDYASKLFLNKELSAVKIDLDEKLNGTTKRVFRDLYVLFTVASAVLIAAAWLYVNVLKVDPPSHTHSNQKITYSNVRV